MKKIFSNLIFLLFIIIFVVLFKVGFGETNLLIGVTTITTILMFMQYDLSANPIKNFLKLIIINILMSLAAYGTLYNVYLGLIINIAMVFIITNTFYHSFRMDMYFPYLLQYAFILFAPIELNQYFISQELLIRMLSLTVGPVLIIIIHLFVHRKNIHKTKINNIKDLISSFSLIIDDEDNKKFDTIKNRIKDMLYTSGEVNGITGVDTIILNVLTSLENICYNLKYYNIEEKKELKVYLEMLNKEIDQKKIIPVDYNDFNNKNLINNIKIIQHNLIKNQMKISTKYALKSEFEKIMAVPKKINMRTIKTKIYSIEVMFSIKVALAFSFTYFISTITGFTEGKWIMFTIISVLVPLYEKANSKIKDRVIATIIGATIISVLFYYIKTPMTRTIVIMIASYINMFMTKYRYKMIFVTISAIGAAALVSTSSEDQEIYLSLVRVTMVIIGVTIGILFNRYVFPYTLKKSNQYEKDRYTSIMNHIIDDFKNLCKKRTYNDKIKSRILRPNLIRIVIDRNIKECDSTEEFNPIDSIQFENVNYIYHYYNCLKYKVIEDKEIKKIIEKINSINEFTFEESKILNKILTKYYD